MGVGTAVKDIWDRVSGLSAAKGAEGERKTVTAPLAGSIFAPIRSGNAQALPKPTATNLRKFAETPVARRAINCIKDRIACMEWRIEARPDAGDENAETRADRGRALRRAFESPNESDSFRTLIEQVLEDVLVGGFGAAEIETTGSDRRPVRLYPVDGATIQVSPNWMGDPEQPRYGQVTGKMGRDGMTPLMDGELMYIRLNPRTHTVFGLGKLEVAFETISSFLQAHRYAGRLAANSVVQYALWMQDRTPEQHERLIQWWHDEVEGTGRVPVMTSETKPEVLRFAGGTDADLRLNWQEFLLSMIANAFDLPAMMLGVSHDVNRSTAEEMSQQAFDNAVVPLAKLIADHLTRDVIMKRLGWDDLRFVWNELDSRDELAEVQIQTQLLQAGVLTVDEVRVMRGLPALVQQ
ncbi:MAG TPA: phage portal protein [Acidobacteriaceae bacterium]|jgi:HK97 family phage portal protein|nr:phage portal protein [Acidobacteriaceae bacterium]